MKQISLLAGAYIGLTMDFDEEISESGSAEEESSDDESATDHACFSRGSGYVGLLRKLFQ